MGQPAAEQEDVPGVEGHDGVADEKLARTAPDQRQFKFRMKVPGTGELRLNELPPGEGFAFRQRNEFKSQWVHVVVKVSPSPAARRKRIGKNPGRIGQGFGSGFRRERF